MSTAGQPAAAPGSVVRLADRAYDRLKGQLYLTLKPGERITESSVAGDLAVSRTPVREALQRLVQEGYLRAHLRNGYTVAPVDFAVVHELYHVRTVLELEAIRLCCGAGQRSAWTDALDRVWKVPRARRLRETDAVSRLNTEFHRALVALGGNRELARVHGEVFDRILLLQRLDFTRDERIDATYDEHAAVLTALAQGRGEEAGRLLAEHISVSRDTVEGMLGRGQPAR